MILFRQKALALLFVTAVVMTCFSCSSESKQVIAKVGSRELNRRGLEAMARIPWDSIATEQKWKIAREWAEQSLVEMEAKKRGFDKDPQLVAQFNALKTELYRAKLLTEQKPSAITDSVVQAYYLLHKKEFLRRKDSFLLEIFFADQKKILSDFCKQTSTLDSVNMDLWGEIVDEGRWWAETGELDKLIEAELETLKPLQYTEPNTYEDGYRALKLIQTYKAGEQIELADVRDEILQRLLLEQSRLRLEKLISDLKEKNTVTFMLPDGGETETK